MSKKKLKQWKVSVDNPEVPSGGADRNKRDRTLPDGVQPKKKELGARGKAPTEERTRQISEIRLLLQKAKSAAGRGEVFYFGNSRREASTKHSEII